MVQRLLDQPLDREHRVQRRVRVLEDRLHPLAERAELLALEACDVLAVEADHARGRVDDLEHHAGRRGLARAGFADDRDGLAARDREGRVLDRDEVLLLAADLEDLREVLDLHDVVRRRGGRPRAAVRRARRRRRRAPARTSRRPRRGIRRLVGRELAERLGPQPHRGHGGRGLHERLRVRLLRVFEDLPRRALLDDPPAVHHDDPRCPLGGEPEVVRDEHERRAELAGHALELVEDRPLHRDIERRGRLVGDQQLGVAGQPDRDESPLAHAARELVRVLLRPLRGVRKSGRGERLDHLAVDVLAGGQAVREERLGDLRADLGDRVQVRHRILRHETDRSTSDAAHHGLGSAHQVLALEQDAALRDAPVSGQQPDHRHRGRGLSRPGLAHDRERLAGREVEVHALHRVHGAVDGAELDGDVADLQQGGAGGDALGGSGHPPILPGEAPGALAGLDLYSLVTRPGRCRPPPAPAMWVPWSHGLDRSERRPRRDGRGRADGRR